MKLTSFLQNTYVPQRGISPPAVGQFLVTIRAFERFLDGPPDLQHLTERTVGDFLADYAAGGRAPTTVNAARKNLLALWRAAADLGHLAPPNPRRILHRKVPRRTPTAWTIDDLAKLLDHLERLPYAIDGVLARHYWPSLVLAIYSTGCRISALLSTRTADCSLGSTPPTILVQAEQTKTLEDRRFTLTAQAARAIALHFDPRRELVWPWPYGRNWFWRRFKQHVLDAGLTVSRKAMGLTHQIRRSNVSYLAKVAGMEAARRSAGHHSSELTARVYVDPRIVGDDCGVELLPEIGTPATPAK